ncbi:pyrimidine reductase family protein [Gordonia sinesedis]
MFYQQNAIQVTPAGAAPTDPTTLRALADLYAYPDPLERPWFRANMISSVDGAVTYQERSGGLGGPGDKALFRVLRALADVVVVGAQTATNEGYRQPAPDTVFADARAAAGQSPAPVLVLLSRSLSIPVDYPPLTSPDTVVLTCADAPADRRRTLVGAGATLVDCGEETVGPAQVLDYCAGRGLVRVLCEGGPRVLGSFIDADLLDDLCLTISPTVIAGDAPRIARSDRAALHPMSAQIVLTDDNGFVFTRWVRQR